MSDAGKMSLLHTMKIISRVLLPFYSQQKFCVVTNDSGETYELRTKMKLQLNHDTDVAGALRKIMKGCTRNKRYS